MSDLDESSMKSTPTNGNPYVGPYTVFTLDEIRAIRLAALVRHVDDRVDPWASILYKCEMAIRAREETDSKPQGNSLSQL
jgi:hypothetical protein